MGDSVNKQTNMRHLLPTQSNGNGCKIKSVFQRPWSGQHNQLTCTCRLCPGLCLDCASLNASPGLPCRGCAQDFAWTAPLTLPWSPSLTVPGPRPGLCLDCALDPWIHGAPCLDCLDPEPDNKTDLERKPFLYINNYLDAWPPKTHQDICLLLNEKYFRCVIKQLIHMYRLWYFPVNCCDTSSYLWQLHFYDLPV